MPHGATRQGRPVADATFGDAGESLTNGVWGRPRTLRGRLCVAGASGTRYSVPVSPFTQALLALPIQRLDPSTCFAARGWLVAPALQAAEKLVGRVIPRGRRRRGISHCLENTQSEIPRSARNDSLEGLFRSLFSPACRPKGRRYVANVFGRHNTGSRTACRHTAGKPASSKRQQAAALQSLFGAVGLPGVITLRKHSSLHLSWRLERQQSIEEGTIVLKG